MVYFYLNLGYPFHESRLSQTSGGNSSVLILLKFLDKSVGKIESDLTWQKIIATSFEDFIQFGQNISNCNVLDIGGTFIRHFFIMEKHKVILRSISYVKNRFKFFNEKLGATW